LLHSIKDQVTQYGRGGFVNPPWATQRVAPTAFPPKISPCYTDSIWQVFDLTKILEKAHDEDYFMLRGFEYLGI
jgi:hypothetical protein